MTEAELIARHIRKHGVKRCPTVALLPTTADVRNAQPLPDPVAEYYYRRSLRGTRAMNAKRAREGWTSTRTAKTG